MKHFDREQIQRDIKAYYRLLASQPRGHWKHLFIEKVAPAFAADPALRCTKELFRPVETHGERVVFQNREGMEMPSIVYRPEGTQGQKLPVLFYLHGGGWCIGSPEQNDHENDIFCRRANCVVVAVGYRLAPKYEFPAAPNDCYDAVTYFVRHAEKFGIDVERMAIGGQSAGATLAIGVCMQAAERKEFDIKLQILCWPNVNLGYVPQDLEGAKDFFVTTPSCYVDTCQLRSPLVSPYYAADETLEQLPTTLLITAELDFLSAQARDWAERVAENGVTVLQKHFAGVSHGFTRYDGEENWSASAEEAVQMQVDALLQYLR